MQLVSSVCVCFYCRSSYDAAWRAASHMSLL